MRRDKSLYLVPTDEQVADAVAQIADAIHTLNAAQRVLVGRFPSSPAVSEAVDRLLASVTQREKTAV
jgi:hypothetical protein